MQGRHAAQVSAQQAHSAPSCSSAAGPGPRPCPAEPAQPLRACSTTPATTTAPPSVFSLTRSPTMKGWVESGRIGGEGGVAVVSLPARWCMPSASALARAAFSSAQRGQPPAHRSAARPRCSAWWPGPRSRWRLRQAGGGARGDREEGDREEGGGRVGSAGVPSRHLVPPDCRRFCCVTCSPPCCGTTHTGGHAAKGQQGAHVDAPAHHGHQQRGGHNRLGRGRQAGRRLLGCLAVAAECVPARPPDPPRPAARRPVAPRTHCSRLPSGTSRRDSACASSRSAGEPLMLPPPSRRARITPSSRSFQARANQELWAGGGRGGGCVRPGAGAGKAGEAAPQAVQAAPRAGAGGRRPHKKTMSTSSLPSWVIWVSACGSGAQGEPSVEVRRRLVCLQRLLPARCQRRSPP